MRGIAVPRSSPRFKQIEVTRAIKAARDAGVSIGHVRIAPDGSIEVYNGAGTKHDTGDAFDAWKANNAHSDKI